ncbi:MAG: hypothetical protein ABIJ86_11665, partial [Spirochaetota bacterium]
MNKALVVSIVALAVLASCVSSPPPAQPEPVAQEQEAATLNADQSRARALVTGGADAGTAVAAAPTPTPAPVPAAADPVDAAPPPPGVLTPDEEAYLKNYLARLNYMVYFDEAAGLNPQSAKIAVNQANRYLIEKQGMTVVDFDQIEKNKKDQQAVYQAETGGSIDLIQYIAQKFNADVYVEISFSTTTSSSGGR